MFAVAPNRFDAALARHDHPVPGKEGPLTQRIGVMQVNVRHHLGDAAFRRRNAPGLAATESKLLAQGGLHTGAIEIFAFDGRGFYGFFADQIDADLVAVIRADMAKNAHKFAGVEQEVPFERFQSPLIIGKIRPVRLLPVPPHELQIAPV